MIIYIHGKHVYNNGYIQFFLHFVAKDIYLASLFIVFLCSWWKKYVEFKHIWTGDIVSVDIIHSDVRIETTFENKKYIYTSRIIVHAYITKYPTTRMNYGCTWETGNKTLHRKMKRKCLKWAIAHDLNYPHPR